MFGTFVLTLKEVDNMKFVNGQNSALQEAELKLSVSYMY